MSTPLPQAKHTLLSLPFTPATYIDPSLLLPIISHAVRASSLSCFVLFSTPHGEQLYTDLRRNPRASFEGLQRFLGRVYSVMAEAQWEAAKVLMDVEVRFEGEHEGGVWGESLGDRDWRVLKLKGKLTPDVKS